MAGLTKVSLMHNYSNYKKVHVSKCLKCMYDDLIDSVLKAIIDHAEGNQMWHICGVLASVSCFSQWPPLAIRWANVQTMKFTWSWHNEYDIWVEKPTSDQQQLVSH